MNKFKNTPYLHPFLFAAFPILFLFANNISSIPPEYVWVPLGVSLLFSLAVLAVGSLIYRNAYKAGLFTSAFVILFFLYQPVFYKVETEPLTAPLGLARHQFFVPVYLLTLAGFGWYLFKTKSSLQQLNQAFNLSCFVLLAPSLFKIAFYAFQPTVKVKKEIIASGRKANLPKPDIYYFIMDSYGRQDVLKNSFGFDNSPFLNSLKKRGFYIADKSTSNYYLTTHSIPSSLNLDYLQALIGTENLQKPKAVSAKELVRNSRLRSILNENGYKYVCFASGISFSEVKDADLYLGHKLAISELSFAVLNITPLPDVLYALFSKDEFTLHRETVLFPFKHMKKAVEVPAPKFVQIHILSPHVPFIFDQDGNHITPFGREFYQKENNAPYQTENEKLDANLDYKTGYANQTTFINAKLLRAIDTILANSASPPVIIIQGDHGARLNSNFNDIKASNHFEGFANLSAFYFPKQDTSGLYPEISPVNIFRVVCNKYFSTQLPLLPDKSYYCTEKDLYKFTDVTEYVKPVHKGSEAKMQQNQKQ